MKAVSCLYCSGRRIVQVHVLTVGISTLLVLLAVCAALLSDGIDAPVGPAKSKVGVHDAVSAPIDGSNVMHHHVVDAAGGAPLETVLPWSVAAVVTVGS